MKNIDIWVEYKKNKKWRHMNNATIEKVYSLSEYITEIKYDMRYGGEFNLCWKGWKREPATILEEMIHQCLPDPDERFLARQGNYLQGNYLWKGCLHMLLLENKP